MATAVRIFRGKSDAVVDEIVDSYAVEHVNAKIDIYRKDAVSVRVRIVDPDFAEQSRPQRSQQVWRYLDRLPEDVQSDISSVLLLSPDETEASAVNDRFDDL